MRYAKRTTFSMKTRTRYACFQISSKKNAPDTMLKASSITCCLCEDGVLKNVPEWEAVYNTSNHQYKCSVANLLRIGSWRRYNTATAAYEDTYYAISKTGAFYLYREDREAFLTILTNAGKIEFQPLETEDGYQYVLFTQGRLVLGKIDGTYKTVITANALPAGAYFKHRLFVAKKQGTLAYSAPEDFSNFIESVHDGGSIRFSECCGEIIAMKVYNDALYVFFANSIMRVEVGGDPCDFHTEKIDYYGGDIFPRTVCACDHGIYFVSKNGVYRVRGKKVDRLPSEMMFAKEEGAEDLSAVFNGSALIRCRDSGGIYRTIIIYENGDVEPMEALQFFSSGQDGRVLFLNSTKNVCRLVESGKGSMGSMGSYFSMPENLGYFGWKTIRKIRLYGEGAGDIYLSNQSQNRSRKISFHNGIFEWEPNMKGELFSFIFNIGRNSEIRKVEIIFETPTSYKEEKI